MFIGTINAVLEWKRAVLPVRMSPGAVGYDLTASQDAIIHPSHTALVHTDLRLEIPDGFAGLIVSRSGLAQRGVVVANGIGIIDPDYRGEICVLLRNLNPVCCTVAAGQRIAQILFVECHQFEFNQVGRLSETDRGAGGFGSTGSEV